MSLRKVLWLTDIHMAGPGQPVHGRDPARHLTAAVEHAARHHPDATACIVSGDLAEKGRPYEYDRVRDVLAPLRMPMATTVGNHDKRGPFAQVFRPSGSFGLAHDVLDAVPGWRIVLLDSITDELEKGSLDRDRLAWLERRLDDTGDRRVLLFLHHPPVATGIPGADSSSLPEEDRRAFAACLARHRSRIRLVGFGHCHLGLSGAVAGVPFVGLESVLFQAHANFADGRFLPDPSRPGAYGVILLGDGDVVVHPVRVPIAPFP